jgi:hypothetical protein
MEKFLAKTLPWLCNSIRIAQSIDMNYVILTGKALTQIVRSIPDIFKLQIMTLSEEQRQYLQVAMKTAIVQEQAQQQQSQHSHSSSSFGGAHGGGGGGTGGGMKISLDKYKK